MININTVGRLGRDAEKHETQNGGSFITLNVATDVFNPKTKQNDTVWLRCTDGSERANKLFPYLKKGSMVNIIGELRTSIYNGQNGPTISHDVRVFNFDFVSTKREDTENTDTNATTVTVSTTSAPTTQVAASTGTFVQPTTSAPSSQSVIDDLPF